MKQHWIAVATAMLILMSAPVGGITQGATETESTLRLTFDVDKEEWSLSKAQLLTEPFSPRWTLRGSSYYAAIFDGAGEVVATVPCGRPELLFHDYQDDDKEVAGGVEQRSKFTAIIKVPTLQPDEQLLIRDSQQRDLCRLSAEEIAGMLQRRRVNWPVYAVDTLMYSGDPANKVDIVFLGDGYLEADSTVFLDCCQMHLNYIFGLVPFAQYSERFNVYAVTTFSNQRGADHPESGVYKDTYYNSEYFGRLLTVDFSIATGVVDEHVPQWDEICAVVQDPTYGGSGGSPIAVSYSASTQVLAHEFGHSFGLLWDEYSYGGNGSVGSAPNCDDQALDPKWQAWIDSLYPGVGAYLGCSYDNTYRPTVNSCMMLELKDYYCIVCVEQLINRVYDFAPSPINAVLPEGDFYLPPGESRLLEVEYANQSDYPQVVSWYLNEVLQPDSTGTSFYFTSPGPGEFDVRVELYDTTSLVLNLDSTQLTTTHNWHITSQVLLCGDSNSDELVNISDVVYLIQYIFAGGTAPEPLEIADSDCDMLVNITDAVYLIGYIFEEGPAPCSACRILYTLGATDTSWEGHDEVLLLSSGGSAVSGGNPDIVTGTTEQDRPGTTTGDRPGTTRTD